MPFDKDKSDSFSRFLDSNKKLEFGSLTEKEWCVLETAPECPERFDRSFPATNGGKWYLRTCGTQVMVWTDQDKKPGYAISLPGKHPMESPYLFTDSESINFWFHLMELMIDPNHLIKDFPKGIEFSKIKRIFEKPIEKDPKK